MDYVDKIKRIEAELLAEKKLCDQALKRAPQGTLHVEKNGDYLAFRQVTVRNGTRTEKMIGRDKEAVQALAEKEYYMAKSRLLQKNIDKLSSMKDSFSRTDFQSIIENMKNGVNRMPQKIFSDTEGNGVLIPHPSRDPGIFAEPVRLRINGMTVEEWAVQPYKENDFHDEHKVHTGHYGLSYRSRHELLVCERLLQRRKAFHYDQLIRLVDSNASPDIIIPDHSGVFTFIEIVELETSEYVADLNHKLEQYADCGIVLGRNLVLIRPERNGAIDLEKFDRIIDAYCC